MDSHAAKYYCHVISWTFFTHQVVGNLLGHRSFSHLDLRRIVRHEFETYVINYLDDPVTLNVAVYCRADYTWFIPKVDPYLLDNYFECEDRVVGHASWGFVSVTCLKVDQSYYAHLVVSSYFQKEHLLPMAHFVNNLMG